MCIYTYYRKYFEYIFFNFFSEYIETTIRTAVFLLFINMSSSRVDFHRFYHFIPIFNCAFNNNNTSFFPILTFLNVFSERLPLFILQGNKISTYVPSMHFMKTSGKKIDNVSNDF